MQRREFLELLTAAAAVASVNGCASLSRSEADSLYRFNSLGQARILHMTDCHAQLNPIYSREPNVNLGVAKAAGRVPHRVGARLLDQVATSDPRQQHALTYLDFTEAAMRFGKVGGFAHLKSLVDQLRAESPGALLLDGGDTWQGSGTALWTQGADMVGACNLLGVDVMTGHWEFTYLESQVIDNVGQFAGEFVAQNIRATEEAMFEGVPVFDEDSEDGQWPADCHYWASLPLYPDCQSQSLHPELDLWHSRASPDGARGEGAGGRATRRGHSFVAQRYGRGFKAGQSSVGH